MLALPNMPSLHDALMHPDVGGNICDALGVHDTRALARTCGAMRESRCSQLTEWKSQWYAAKQAHEAGAHTFCAATTMMGQLCLRGHLALAQSYHSNGYHVDLGNCEPFSMAVSGGHIEVLEWLRATGYACAPPESASVTAALKGRIEVLEWLHANGHLVERTPRPNGHCFLLTGHAVLMGHTHAFKWLCNREFQSDDSAEFWAADNGNVELLQWLYAKGLAWGSASGFRQAAMKGNINVLEWLHERGCPFDKGQCVAAARHEKTRQWLGNVL